MKLAIMQPYLFSYIGYFQLIHSVDHFVIYDDVNFIKNGWINRNRILIGGKPAWFTLQLQGASSNKLINEVCVGGNANKLLKTLQINYSKAPYFEQVFPLAETILLNPEKNIARFIGDSLQKICTCLGIETIFSYSSEIEKDNELRAQDKVLDICRRLDAKVYNNPIGGMGLYRKEAFAEKGIQLSFIKSEPIVYPQFGNKFVPSLSIIDVMMFNHVGRIHEYLELYELV